jgi:hypothetical protein
VPVFWWFSSATDEEIYNYEQSLTSKILDGGGFYSVWLDYDIWLYNYSSDTLEQLAVKVYDGSDWHQVALYDNVGVGDDWWSEHGSIDISAYASDALQVQFTAFGEDSYNIDFWQLDNIVVVGNSAVVPAPGAAILALLGLLTVQLRRQQ